jgi:hypothetical protein
MLMMTIIAFRTKAYHILSASYDRKIKREA